MYDVRFLSYFNTISQSRSSPSKKDFPTPKKRMPYRQKFQATCFPGIQVGLPAIPMTPRKTNASKDRRSHRIKL